MARAPRRGEVRRALEPLLGLDGCLTLQAALLLDTYRWSALLEPRAVYVAHDPADAGRELQRLLGDGVSVFPQNGEGISGRLADAVARVASHSPGPMVIVWPDLPRLREAHAAAVLTDLSEGVDVVLGPVFDGGYYLIGLSRALPSLFGLPEEVWRSSGAMGSVMEAASLDGLQVGLMRAERALHRPADVRAALADPLLPQAVGRVLGRL